MKVTSKGQITIPADLRDEYGFLPHSELKWERGKKGLILKKAKSSRRRGEGIIKHMKGSSTIKMKTDDIMRLTRGDND